jgi:hypothetical protein
MSNYTESNRMSFTYWSFGLLLTVMGVLWTPVWYVISNSSMFIPSRQITINETRVELAMLKTDMGEGFVASGMLDGKLAYVYCEKRDRHIV